MVNNKKENFLGALIRPFYNSSLSIYGLFMKRNVDDLIEKNLHKMFDYRNKQQNLGFYYSPTVSIFNVDHLPDMHRYLIDNGLADTQTLFLFNIFNIRHKLLEIIVGCLFFLHFICLNVIFFSIFHFILFPQS